LSCSDAVFSIGVVEKLVKKKKLNKRKSAFKMTRFWSSKVEDYPIPLEVEDNQF
jgi:hypothetical protein